MNARFESCADVGITSSGLVGWLSDHHLITDSFVTGVTYLKQWIIVAWALALWAFTFTFSFGFTLNMEILMDAHVGMFGVAAALWSLVGKLQTTQRWQAGDTF
ncbi:hypothetical protein [Bradyrhizobium neotropicale]|uniref:hypothetical protein n=1 Tax=Bradyrhizobium neotropicale TaxID=1497615 RepID=UPI001AD7DDCE|nr:hypothetical protein [Bradyrhizobium neotropicale]MBO4224748.1 hypothetical protein [Bradyrhizobium neotropicale]